MNYELRTGILQITAPAEAEGTSLSAFLGGFHISSKKRYELFTNHEVTLNRTDANGNEILHEKDKIAIRLEESEPDYTPAPFACDVVYEDDFVFAAHKEPGFIVHDADDDTCLASQAAAWMNEAGIRRPVRFIHRLDRETTGLVLFVKEPLLSPWYDAMLEAKKIDRQYLAITAGRGKVGQKFTYNQKIGRDRHESGKYRFSETGKEAITKAVIVDKKKDDILMRCRLLTGRTHQIRVHLSGNRHPILNDPLYGVPSSNYRHMGLWADTLIVPNPFTNETVTITDLPNADYARFKW